MTGNIDQISAGAGVQGINSGGATSPAGTVSTTGRSRTAVIRDVTMACLAACTGDQLHDGPYVESLILDETAKAIKLANTSRSHQALPKWKVPDKLQPAQIADIIAYVYPVKRIISGGSASDPDYDILAVYQTDGSRRGIYDCAEESLRKLARQYTYDLSTKEISEIIAALHDLVERVYPCDKKNLIAVNNGIFDYDTKQLLPFDETYVFLSKCKVDYIPNAVMPVIHDYTDGTDWDPESWMYTVSDDPAVVELFWQILGAIIRPLVPWNKSAWFYSETGNNGKGTLCELMRQLCGEGTYASIPLADFSKDFALEPLLHASAIITDENAVGEFIDRSSNLKSVITGDVLTINRKFKQMIPYRFRGFMVQCLNEFPRVKDKSGSFLRRCLIVPFTSCFEGVEKKHIKEDYLHRRDVLEYVLWKVLNMDYYELSEPEVCKATLEEFNENNNPVLEFLHEFLPKFTWDLLPYAFLYALFVEWYKRSYSKPCSISSKSFNKEVRYELRDSTEWIAVADNGKGRLYKRSTRMDKPEPLIWEYRLEGWMNKAYANDPTHKKNCMPPHDVQAYRGIIRASALTGSPDDDDD